MLTPHNMYLTRISDCRKELDFEPKKKWPPGLPAIAWESLLLCGFDREPTAPVVNLDASEQTLLETLCACYPKLTLVELARLQALLPTSVSTEQLLSSYGLRHSGRGQQIMDLILNCPRSFQDWSMEKDLAVGDLQPLTSLKEAKQIQWLCETIVRQNPSKSVGVKIIEWLAELLLMDNSPENLGPKASEENTRWQERLKSLRFAQSYGLDSIRNHQVKKLPWPKATWAQWVRKGDSSGIEVKFVASSEQEFNKKLTDLNKVAERLKSQGAPFA